MKSYSSDVTLTMINTLLDINPRLQGKSYLEQLCLNIWQTFQPKYLAIAKTIGTELSKAETVIFMKQGVFLENFVYDLSGTPCEKVTKVNRVCLYPNDIVNRFPEDTFLVDMGVESYIGAATLNEQGPSGLIALMDDEEIADSGYYKALIEFLASRVSFELERYINEQTIEALTKKCEVDALTKTLTRGAFFEKYNLHDAKTGAMLFIDADDFKQINDTYGHQRGDDVLSFFAEQIMASVRDEDLVGRYGGEEFIVFLPCASAEIANAVADRIHSYLRVNCSLNISLTVSIGLTTFQANESLSSVIKRADRAVYDAKNAGKNCTVAC